MSTKCESQALGGHGLGWRKDPPDEDAKVGRHETWHTFKQLIPGQGNRLKDKADYREYFPAVRDQGIVDSSTAFACLAVFEYFEHRALGALCERSKAFLHFKTQVSAVSGAIGRGCSIRDTLRTLTRYGSPPEIYWPYSAANCRTVPDDRLLFSFARDFQGLRCARLDEPDSTGRRTLRRARKCLALGIPVVFGFEVHHLSTASRPFPIVEPFYALGWQTVVACGYDHTKKVLLVRNSWGRLWEDAGHAWLPYKYVARDHAADFWVLFKDEWIERLAQANAKC